MILLVVIITYHVYTLLHSKCSKGCSSNSTQTQNHKSETTKDTAVGDSVLKENCPTEPTFSVVDLGEPDCNRQSSAKVPTSEEDQASRLTSEIDGDPASLVSTDSTSPLLDDYD